MVFVLYTMMKQDLFLFISSTTKQVIIAVFVCIIGELYKSRHCHHHWYFTEKHFYTCSLASAFSLLVCFDTLQGY